MSNELHHGKKGINVKILKTKVNPHSINRAVLNITFPLKYYRKNKSRTNDQHNSWRYKTIIVQDERGYPYNVFLISPQKHMLWVLIKAPFLLICPQKCVQYCLSILFLHENICCGYPTEAPQSKNKSSTTK